jgi:hypothetical protein
MSNNIWDEIGNGTSKVFNGGVAGEAIVDVTVEKIPEGATGPKGNPLPAALKYQIIFKDAKNSEARSVSHGIFEMKPEQINSTNADESKGNFLQKKSAITLARSVFEVICPGENLPEGTDAGKIMLSAYESCVGKPAQRARGFFHYAKGNKPDSYLNFNSGLDKTLVPASDTTTQFKSTLFMSRPQADVENTSTNAPVVDDLPF